MGTLVAVTPENMKSFNVRMKPVVWDEAKAIAEAKGDRISEVVRDLLKEYIRKNRRYLTSASADPDPD